MMEASINDTDALSKSYPHYNSVDSGGSLSTTEQEMILTKLYPKRFLILAIFCFGMFFNAFAYVQYSVIADVVTSYYDVTYMSVNMSSILFNLCFIVAMFPAIWLFETKGLKFGMVIGSIGNALGFAIKCIGIPPNYFWVAMFGQTFLALSQACFLTITPHVASVWFGAGEVSRAGAAGIFSNSFGVAICGLIMPMIVTGTDENVIKSQFAMVMYTVAGITTVVAIIAVLFCEDRPALPPSLAQHNLRHLEETNSTVQKFQLKESVKNLLSNPNFILVVLGFSLSYSVVCSVSTVANQMLLGVFPDAKQDVGNMVLTLQLCCVLGTVIDGIVLDKTHQYKATAVINFLLGGLSVGAFTLLLYTKIVYVYVAIALIGLFVGGFMTVGLDLGVEISYPISEVTSLGTAGVVGNVISLVFVVLCGWVLDTYGALPTNLIMVGIMVVGLALMVPARIELKRLMASLANEESS